MIATLDIDYRNIKNRVAFASAESNVTAVVTRADIFDLLSVSWVGAYGTAPDGTVLLWNRRAEQILGHAVGDVLGAAVGDVLGAAVGVAPIDDTTTEVAAASPGADDIPSPVILPLRCASGAYKSVTLTVLVIVDGGLAADTVLVHLFDDSADATAPSEDAVAGTQLARAAPEPSRVSYVGSGVARLSARELQILELIAAGRSPELIARMLGISVHTVRNHVRNLRGKLKAKTKLDAVMAAVRQGLL